jgi:TRAP-type C4-dicarboxylate transport system substrate-binding protein
MREKGIQIDEPDLAPFKAMMEPAYAKIKKNVGEENFNKWLEMADELR